MTMKDGRAVARENEVRVLRALHRCGWLRTRDLGALVWRRWARQPAGEPSLTPAIPTAAGMRMAQRTLKRLRDKRQVLSSRAPDGSLIYALAEGGARLLQELGLAAASGKDLMRTFSTAHYRHRCISNSVAISAIVEGYRVSTEREVAQGAWLGGEAGIAAKRPDVLIRGNDRVWWIEVERSRKNDADYARLLAWLQAVKQDIARPSGASLLGANLRWGKVVFVCTVRFRHRLSRDLIAAGWSESMLAQFILYSTDLYGFEDINFI